MLMLLPSFQFVAFAAEPSAIGPMLRARVDGCGILRILRSLSLLVPGRFRWGSRSFLHALRSRPDRAVREPLLLDRECHLIRAASDQPDREDNAVACD